MTRPSLQVVEGGKRPPGLGAALELAVLGFALTLVVAWMGQLPSWFHELGRFQVLYAAAFGIYALALARLERFSGLPHVGWAVLAVAIATRAALLATPPSLSGDIYRYVWEGKVLAHGMNPYLLRPADPALASLRDSAVYPFVNHPELSAIYPPLALAGYALVASVSPTVAAFKLWIVLHDIALVVVLLVWMRRRGASEACVLAYAWNPLVLVEFAGSGHNDPTGMLWLVLALMWGEARPVLSAVALATGALTKLVPLAALPFLWRRWTWRARGTALALTGLGLTAYVALTRAAYSGLAAYWGTWRNNELLFHYLDRWTGSFRTARAIGWTLAAAAIAWALARRWSAERGTAFGIRAMLLAGPVLHPWYLGWTLLFEPFGPSWGWLLLSLTASLNYGVLETPKLGRDFHVPLEWRWLEYGLPLILACVLFGVRRMRHREPPRPAESHR